MSKKIDDILERIKRLPEEPGCYLMKDHKGKVFYVGKAINLRSRVRNYFSGQDTRAFVGFLERILADIETIVVRNETEALLLEQTLIRTHKPRYNVLLKDDKNYILLRLDMRKQRDDNPKHRRYPRLEIVRKAKSDGARYFGPYPSASQLRTTLHLINKNFQLRTCPDHVIDNRARPCIQYQIGRCSAPCVQEVPSYTEEIADVVLFLTGQTSEIEKRLKQRMWQASEDENYELAARLRDQLQAIQTSLAEQAVTDVQHRIDQDIIAAARKGPYLEIVRMVVRVGRILGSQTYSFKQQEFPTEELVAGFLGQLYQGRDPGELPDEILLSIDIGEEAKLLQHALSERKGKKIVVKKPERGRGRDLIEIATKNADEALGEHLRQRDAQQYALEALQKVLNLSQLPHIIECFDISIFQGTDAVASQVCFVDGAPDKNRYRKFNIKTVEGMDDFAMLYEAVSRRLKRGLEESNLPNLLLVDGGKGQLGVALAACKDLGIEVSRDGLFVAGIAKARTDKSQDKSDDKVAHSEERLFIPGVKDPILLKTHSAERYLVERLRDEAHRFAITAHRAKRKKSSFNSVLDKIPGIGKKRQQLLLKHFGSAQAVLKASLEELAKAPGLNIATARNIYAFLNK